MKPILAVTIALLTLLTLAVPVSAVSDPDNLQILNARAYTNYVEDDDFLVVILYNIDYASLPTEPASDTYLAKLLLLGSELQSVVPVPFNDLGYGAGVLSFYFTAAEVTNLGITTTSGTYTIRLQGNPSVFASPPVVETTSLLFRSPAFTKSLLKEDVIVHANTLELSWASNNVDLISGDILTDTGEEYFERTIPNIRSVISEIFSGSISNPPVQGRDTDFNQDLVTQRQNFIAGTAMYANLVALSDEWDGPTEDGTTFVWIPLTLIWYAILAIAIFLMLKIPGVSQKGFEVSALIVVVGNPFGAYLGFVNPIFAIVIAFILGVGALWIILGSRGG